MVVQTPAKLKSPEMMAISTPSNDVLHFQIRRVTGWLHGLRYSRRWRKDTGCPCHLHRPRRLVKVICKLRTLPIVFGPAITYGPAWREMLSPILRVRGISYLLGRSFLVLLRSGTGLAAGQRAAWRCAPEVKALGGTGFRACGRIPVPMHREDGTIRCRGDGHGAFPLGCPVRTGCGSPVAVWPG